MRKLWEKDTWDVRRSVLGTSHFQVPPAPLKPENQGAGEGWRCPSQRTVAVTLVLPLW